MKYNITAVYFYSIYYFSGIGKEKTKIFIRAKFFITKK